MTILHTSLSTKELRGKASFFVTVMVMSQPPPFLQRKSGILNVGK